ncbi:hypothetical protein BS618_27740 [Rhodococcus erythropolis]|uniref:hypothetical protein n=1 Tax=Rhodococcus TaxID=1827 RepID=UPI0009374FB9|nr:MULTISPECIES: hypothetical protein [Rhodococcus]MBP2522448.1 hypothetical protein [Rhodococcus sp. PvP104]MCZ4546341.1 hypothetical protein [Rhodococcus qingshengii]MDA3632019.1 hypothetical protein [Rhodococcus sp. C-2]OKA11595.1 hypothetical protein BS618_27740 [Rhodococcus erythropolis]
MVEIGSGLSAVLGALVGGSASYAGTWLNLKFQAKQAKHSRANLLSDRRQNVHQELLSTVYMFVERSRVVCELLDARDTAPNELATAKAQYVLAWEEISLSRGAALLAGPQAVSEDLLSMLLAASEYSLVIDRWLAGKGKSQSLDTMRQNFYDARLKYIETARKHLELD